MALLAVLSAAAPAGGDKASRLANERQLAAALRALKVARSSDTIRGIFALLTRASIREQSVPGRVAAVAILARSLRSSQGDETLFRDVDGAMIELGMDAKSPPGSSAADQELARPFVDEVDLGSPKSVAAALLQQLSVLEACIALPGFSDRAVVGGGVPALAASGLNLLQACELVSSKASGQDSRSKMGAGTDSMHEAAVRAVRVVDKLLRTASPALAEAIAKEAKEQEAASGGKAGLKAPARSGRQLAKLLRSAASMAVMTRGLQENARDKNKKREQIQGAMQRAAAEDANAAAAAARARNSTSSSASGDDDDEAAMDPAELAAATKGIEVVAHHLAQAIRGALATAKSGEKSAASGAGSASTGDESARAIGSKDTSQVVLLLGAARHMIDAVLSPAGSSILPATSSSRGRSGTAAATASTSGTGSAGDPSSSSSSYSSRWSPTLIAAISELLVDCTAAARDVATPGGKPGSSSTPTRSSSSVSLATEAALLTGLLSDSSLPPESYRYVSACLAAMSTGRGIAALAGTGRRASSEMIRSIAALLSGLSDAARSTSARAADAAQAITSVGLFLHTAIKEIPVFSRAVQKGDTVNDLLEATGALADAARHGGGADPEQGTSQHAGLAAVKTARSTMRRVLTAAVSDDRVAGWCAAVKASASKLAAVNEAGQDDGEAAEDAAAAADPGAASPEAGQYAVDEEAAEGHRGLSALKALLKSYRGINEQMPGS